MLCALSFTYLLPFLFYVHFHLPFLFYVHFYLPVIISFFFFKCALLFTRYYFLLVVHFMCFYGSTERETNKEASGNLVRRKN